MNFCHGIFLTEIDSLSCSNFIESILMISCLKSLNLPLQRMSIRFDFILLLSFEFSDLCFV